MRQRHPAPRTAAAALVALVVVAGAAGLLRNRGDGDELGSPVGAPPVSDIGRGDVGFRGAGDLLLRGTLDLPANTSGHLPGVVIVPGFGPTTRDGIASGGVVVDPFYRDLGEALADAGFVVLRYDKRGTGHSGPVPEAEELSWDDLVADAAAAADYLRGRPEVLPDDVALVGHDEGGLVGMRVAGGDARIAALVLVSTPGRPLVDVLAGEIRGGALTSSERRADDRLARELERAVARLLATGEAPAVSDELRAILPPDRTRYLTEVFSLDPRAEARRVGVPVLIVRGERDPGIRTADVRSLRRALVDSGAEVLNAPDAGHTLEVFSEAADEHGGGGGPPQRDRDALRALVRWLHDVLGR